MNWDARLATRTVGMMRAARFADAVAARHAGDPGAWLRCATPLASAPRVLLRRRRVPPAGAPVTITIAPRLELCLATMGTRAEDVARSSTARHASVRRELGRTMSAPSAAPILRRASERVVRDDGQSAGPSARVRPQIAMRHAASEGTTPANAISAPPARVLRRRTSPSPPSPAPVRDEPSARAPQPPRSVSLSPVEINRLTDHIVQTIDRRIVAFRERQGRV